MRTSLWSLLLAVAVAHPSLATDAAEHFESRVRPLLAKHCYACHTSSALGGLRVDSREALLKGGASGPALVPGDPDASLLLRVVTHRHDRLKMPPAGKLPEGDAASLAAWIKDGAVWPTAAVSSAPVGKAGEYVITPEQRAWWAFQPVRKPAAPAVRNTAWPRTDIDRFLLARLEQKGLKPARFADRRTLIRRAALDLTGLPPTPEEVDAFLADKGPDAFAKVVDWLLASPRYGERWGRHWLDVARYSDDRLNSTQNDPHPNAFRYRDWVIAAVNRDLPYDQFVRAQIAGDALASADPLEFTPALGFYSLSPEMQDERVDATTRGFLGLTVACAQCHDHKFDPIPTKDFYSLQGVFSSTEMQEVPLAPAEQVSAFKAQQQKLEKSQATLKRFLQQQADQVAEVLAAQTARYLLAARGLSPTEELDADVLARWRDYLKREEKQHSLLTPWLSLQERQADRAAFEKAAQEFQRHVVAVFEEKREIDDKNRLTLGPDPSRRDVSQANLMSLDREKFGLWQDLFGRSANDAGGLFKTPDGVLFFGEGKVERFLPVAWQGHAKALKAQVEEAKKFLPPRYAFIQSIRDVKEPKDLGIAIRGDVNNRGDVAPRRFLAILSPDQPAFKKGSGRAELADAIADPNNPLTARVFVNRVWQWHFGQGLVRTPSNFGRLGDLPSHPELLDHLAARFVEQGWSMKRLHRDILLSAAYALSAEPMPANLAADPENRLLWRFNRQRLDAETLRDAILFVSGSLDPATGGEPAALTDDYRRRTVYGMVSRRRVDGMLALFDFPNPNATAEQRLVTNVPLQRLFLMNSPFLGLRAAALAGRLTGPAEARITQAHRLLYGRAPDPEERSLGLAYAAQHGWPQYAQVLLMSNEFLFVD